MISEQSAEKRFQPVDGDAGPGVYFAERFSEEGHTDAYRGAQVLAWRTKSLKGDECVVVKANLAAQSCYEPLHPENKEFFREAYRAARSEAKARRDGSEGHVTTFGVLRKVLAFYGPIMAIQATRFVFSSRDENGRMLDGPIFSVILHDLNCNTDAAVLPKI